MRTVDLELTDEMLERNDDIDNAVYDCICVLAEKELPWSMEIITKVTETIKAELLKYQIQVRHPSVETKEDGNQIYSSF